MTSVDHATDIDAARLAVSMRYVVPFGGLLRGRLAAGETVIVSGAGRIAGGPVEGKARMTFHNLQTAVHAASATLPDVAQALIYLRRASDMPVIAG